MSRLTVYISAVLVSGSAVSRLTVFFMSAGAVSCPMFPGAVSRLAVFLGLFPKRLQLSLVLFMYYGRQKRAFSNDIYFLQICL